MTVTHNGADHKIGECVMDAQNITCTFNDTLYGLKPSTTPRTTQFSRPDLVPCLPRPFADALQTLSRPRDRASDANPTARYPRSPWYFPGVGLVPRPSAESGPHRT